MPQAAMPVKAHELKIGKFLSVLRERTVVMGILNRTPDSFSDGGMFTDDERAIRHAVRMAEEGADIIDVGGESTRPGSEGVSPEEELKRTVPFIERLVREIDIPISIDTTKRIVAKEAIGAGASMVNDITGLKGDPGMAGTVAASGVLLSVMHIKGTPRDMQVDPVYDDLISEIISGLRESVSIAAKSGVSGDRIIVDPGIGFGKTTGHNLRIISRLGEFKVLGKPILIGLSRKSFIGNLTGKDTGRRLIGTAASSALAIANGANIIRAHDVKEAVDVRKVADAIKRENNA